MEEKKKVVHIMILYGLVVGLGALFMAGGGVTGEITAEDATDGWTCIQSVCTASEPAGNAWAQQNCGFVEVNGTQVQACQVVIDGQQQVVPLSAINLSAIRSCTQMTCLQEVRVRNVNYTMPAEGQQ